MADVSQIKLPNGSVYDLIDEKSGYITAQYIENKTDYSIPVSRVGEIEVGETVIGTDSTNFPTSKAVVDYVDERVVQEIEAIDIPTVPTKTSDLTNDSGYLTASDIASVMTYKGTKANYAALPFTGNTTGDVWHLTDTGAEWAWDGSAWQELGTAIDLSNYATKATTLAGYGIIDAKIQNGTITLGSNSITPLTSFTETDPTVPSWAKASTKPSYSLTEISGTDDLRAIEALTGTSGLLKKTAANTWTLDTNTYLTSYTETDPVFTASAAAGITSTDISNWNGKSSTDEKLAITQASFGANQYYPIFGSGTSAQTRLYDSNFCYQPSTDYAILTLGNTETGTKIGNLNLCYQNYVVWLQPTVLTNHRSIYLPDKGGTIALTSDIPVNTNTTYTLSNALASHKFTSTLTAGGSGSGTSTATMEFVAGTGITLTDDTTNKKITIASSVVNTDEKVKLTSVSTAATYPLILGPSSITSGTAYEANYTNKISLEYGGTQITLKVGDTTNNQLGAIQLYSNNTAGWTVLKTDASISRAITLPDKNGTIALTSDVPQVYSSTNTGGYLTMATLPIYDGTVE